MHICVGTLIINGHDGSENDLWPSLRQAITWTNAGILLIGPLGTNFDEILIKIHTFSLKKIHLKMTFGKVIDHIDGLAQDCSISIANTLEILQSWLSHWYVRPSQPIPYLANGDISHDSVLCEATAAHEVIDSLAFTGEPGGTVGHHAIALCGPSKEKLTDIKVR